MGIRYYQLVFVCMGCQEIFGGGIQAIPVNTKAVWPSWEWDGDLLKPTVTPEIQVNDGENYCISSLTGGIFRYHHASTHRFSGYNGYAQPFPDWYLESLELQEMAPNN